MGRWKRLRKGKIYKAVVNLANKKTTRLGKTLLIRLRELKGRFLPFFPTFWKVGIPWFLIKGSFFPRKRILFQLPLGQGLISNQGSFLGEHSFQTFGTQLGKIWELGFWRTLPFKLIQFLAKNYFFSLLSIF